MGIHQAFFGSYPTTVPPSQLWSIPVSSFTDSSSNYTISNLQIGDIVCFASSSSTTTQTPLPGWGTFLSGFNNPEANFYSRKAIIDTSFTIPSSWISTASPDNTAVVVIRSNKNTIDLMDQVALYGNSSGFASVPTSNFFSEALASTTNDPLALCIGWYDDDDSSTSGAPSADWTYLGLTADSNSTIVGAWSLEAEGGDTAPPSPGSSFSNPSSVSGNNTSVVMYYSAYDRTPATWTVVDSEFKDVVDSESLTVNNLQQGDLLFFAQAADFTNGSLDTTAGWTKLGDGDNNDPSFLEQVRNVGSGETSVTVDCDFDAEAGALVAFRCSTGTANLAATAFALGAGSSGQPTIPSNHFGTLGPDLPFTSANDCLQITSGYLDDDQITTCTAPTGLTLIGFASGEAFSTRRSSLMIAYGVSMKNEQAPLANGRSFSTDGNDDWYCTTWYVNPS